MSELSLRGELSLRKDLIVSRQQTCEGTRFVVKDPRTGRYFRFREAEYAITRRLNGDTPLDTIACEVSAELNVTADAESLKPFIEQLRRQGLLEGQAVAPSGRKLYRGNLLWLRLKAFDPDRLFDRLLPWVRFCFTPHFVLSGALLIACATIIAVTKWDEVINDLARLWRFQSLLLAWVVILAVTTAHEFAHGLTCKRFGGHVHEIGFLLIYFQPAFYCNISDAWLFPEKSKRLWVTFAGAYFETIIWALATLVWWVTDVDNAVNFLALVVMTTSGIKAFFNLNPLIKLDGYYLLSDYLEIPNLRQKSFSYLKEMIAKLWRSTVHRAQVSGRERRIYVTYGLLAAVYTYWLLSVVALHLGSWLVDQYQGFGFIVFMGLLMAVFQNPLSRAGSRLKAAFVFSQPRLAPLKTRPRLLLLAAIFPALFIGRADLKVAGEFKILPGHNADVRAQVDGIIAQVYVDEGDYVRAGDPVVRLEERDNRAQFRQVEAQILETRARLGMLRQGPRDQEVALARTSLETARTRQKHLEKQYEEAKRQRETRRSRAETAVTAAHTRLQYDNNDLERTRALFETGLIPRTQLERTEEQVRLREKELETARAEVEMIVADELAQLGGELAVATRTVDETAGKLNVLVAGSRPEEIQAMEAELQRLEAQRRNWEEQLRLALIVTLAPGVVVTPRLKEKLGEHVGKGNLVAEVYELERVTPEIVISEKEIGEVKRGQPVILRARAYPETSFAGTVKAISPIAADSNGPERKVFRVMVEMAETTNLLRSEMTGSAKIFCGRRSIFHLLTRRLARYVRIEFWSWW